MNTVTSNHLQIAGEVVMRILGVRLVMVALMQGEKAALGLLIGYRRSLIELRSPSWQQLGLV